MTTNPTHLRYHELNRKRGRPNGQVTLRIEYKGQFGDGFDLLMVSPRKMEEITRTAGWKAIKLYKEEDDYAAVLSKLSQ